MGYFNSFPASFGQNTFFDPAFATGVNVPGIDPQALSNIDFNQAATLGFDPLAYDNSVDLSHSVEDRTWTFITAPMNVSWQSSNKADRVDMFGTNSPPVVTGTKGMRDLKLSDALVEGFTRKRRVEAKIVALENLMNYNLNSGANGTGPGFVNVPVYQVFAQGKIYGDNGYFIIKSVNVKETLRDLQGYATRATVDIDLMQVPEYQVDSGIDQASTAVTGSKSKLDDVAKQVNQNKATKPNPLSNATGKVLKSVQVTKGQYAGFYKQIIEDPITHKLTTKYSATP